MGYQTTPIRYCWKQKPLNPEGWACLLILKATQKTIWKWAQEIPNDRKLWVAKSELHWIFKWTVVRGLRCTSLAMHHSVRFTQADMLEPSPIVHGLRVEYQRRYRGSSMQPFQALHQQLAAPNPNVDDLANFRGRPRGNAFLATIFGAPPKAVSEVTRGKFWGISKGLDKRSGMEGGEGKTYGGEGGFGNCSPWGVSSWGFAPTLFFALPLWCSLDFNITSSCGDGLVREFLGEGHWQSQKKTSLNIIGPQCNCLRKAVLDTCHFEQDAKGWFHRMRIGACNSTLAFPGTHTRFTYLTSEGRAMWVPCLCPRRNENPERRESKHFWRNDGSTLLAQGQFWSINARPRPLCTSSACPPHQDPKDPSILPTNPYGQVGMEPPARMFGANGPTSGFAGS